jgi:hypothetical protein
MIRDLTDAELRQRLEERTDRVGRLGTVHGIRLGLDGIVTVVGVLLQSRPTAWAVGFKMDC